MKNRVRLIPVMGVLAFVLSSCIWPAFRNGPERTGFNSGETALGAANVGALTLKWTAEVGPATASSPAIANGVVYITGPAVGLAAFSAGGTTGCSGAPKTCTPLWVGPMDVFSGSSPAVSGGVVYVGGNVNNTFDGVDGVLYAFDAAGSTGCSGTPTVCHRLWIAESESPAASSPVVANGLVYMGVDGLQAFDAAGSTGCSGTPKVCAPVWGTTGSGGLSSPAVAGGVAYQLSSGTLEAYDATGATNCSGTPATCTPTWTATNPPGPGIAAPFDSSPAVSGGLLYIGSGDGKVRAFKTAATFPQCTGVVPKTCNPAWSRTIGANVVSSPAVANGVVYVGSDDDKLYALNATTGAVLWTAPTGGDVDSSPTVANGVVYVGSDDGKLYAFDAAGTTGCSGSPTVCTPLWSHTTGGEVASSPSVVSGNVYVASTDGKLYAFGL